MRRVVPAIAAFVALSAAAHGQPGTEAAEHLAAPAADLIAPELLKPAVREAVVNGVATLLVWMTAPGNERGLAFPPVQTVTVVEMVDAPARRVKVEQPEYEHEYADVETLVPVIESSQPTGRFTRQTQRVIVKSRQVGKKVVEHLVPDKDGTETVQVPRYAAGGPAPWPVNLPGLNGMALYVLVKAGLAKHPATVRHAAALAEYADDPTGLPDGTFDVAWMAAGFCALGPGSPHEKTARRLIDKLLDGQVLEKGEVHGLWGPVCVNYGYFGKLMSIGQSVRQELDVQIPKRLETAAPAERERLIALGKEMRAFVAACDRSHRDVFRAGTRMLEIETTYTVEDRLILPGLPFNAYRWVVTDVESTGAATFALAVAKQAGLLPQETERLAIRRKSIHPPVRTDAVIKAAAKRMAAAIDGDGGATALAFVAQNKGFDKTGFPAPSLPGPAALPPMFGYETACTTVAAQETLESLADIDPEVAKLLDGPRKRARDRAARIAARWYAESTNPAAEAWAGMYAGMKVPHADLARSGTLDVSARSGGAVESLPWGPQGCLYRIVPGFRGLFAGENSDARYGDDLFRQIAYRLVALQDQNGQWATAGTFYLLSTASESLTIGRVAQWWHQLLTRAPPEPIGMPDPAGCDGMLRPIGWNNCHYGAWIDNYGFPTLASLLFLVEATDVAVSLDGIEILPEPAAEPANGQPTVRPTPHEAARRVVRPNMSRQNLFEAILASRRPRTTDGSHAPTIADERDRKPAAAEDHPPREDDGLGTFEDFLKPADAKD